MFVAETTGRPGFIVPGLLASVVAQLVMGDTSVSRYQTTRRAGHLEGRFAMPITAAIDDEVQTVASDATLQDLALNLLDTGLTDVPVVTGSRYEGMATIHALHETDRREWTSTRVSDLAIDDWPTGAPDWTIQRAIRTMNDAGVDTLPVVHEDNFVGVVTTTDLVRLDEADLDRG
jgi:CBS domain-containing protein